MPLAHGNGNRRDRFVARRAGVVVGPVGSVAGGVDERELELARPVEVGPVHRDAALVAQDSRRVAGFHIERREKGEGGEKESKSVVHCFHENGD
ncbi:MAG: hypothetical protein H7A52_09630 [Akkermansiaceae bacterium]|nr:hypothetical protein [Akkermansiaceae bacterium]